MSGLTRKQAEFYLARHDEQSAHAEACLPPIEEQLHSLEDSIKRHVALGLPIVSDEVLAEREAACRACDRKTPDGQRCLECGCFLEVKRKWAGEACRLRKWAAVGVGGCGTCGK